MRTIASLGGFVATRSEQGIQVHQYVPSDIQAECGDSTVRLQLATAYPIDGAVTLTVVETGADAWTLGLRLPSWCRDATLTVNGVTVDASADQHGYLRIHRPWQAGDVVADTMGMPPRLTVAHPAVDAVRDMVAVERGPLVYCFESPDQAPGIDLNRVEILVGRPLAEEFHSDLLGQPIVTVRVAAIARDDSAWSGMGWATLGEEPERSGREVELVAVPYHLWANRGPSVMRIFTPARSGERIHDPGPRTANG
jgi:DUF1680 family protein